MSLTKNIRLYQDFTTNGHNFRLSFYPGDVEDLSFNPNVVFPLNTFIGDIIINGGFPDDLPFGRQMAMSMKLNINLNALHDDQQDVDYAIVREWILSGQSETTRLVNGEYIYIPNRWVLQEIDEDGDPTATYFNGVQQVTSKKTHKFDYKKKIHTFEVEAIGIEKTVYEHVLFKDLTPESTPTTSKLLNISYDPEAWGVQVYNYSSGFTCVLNSIMDILGAIDSVASLYFAAYMRDETLETSTTSTLFSGWQFYEQQFTDLEHGNEIPSLYDIYLVVQILNGEQVIGGLYSEDSESSWAAEYKNVWEWLGVIAEQFLNNIIVVYGAEGTTLQIQSKDVFYYNEPTLELYRENIKAVNEFVENAYYIPSVSYAISDKCENDVDELVYKDGTATTSDDGQEFQSPIQTHHNSAVSCQNSSSLTIESVSPYKSAYCNMERHIIRNLYYLASTIEIPEGHAFDYVQLSDYYQFTTGFVIYSGETTPTYNFYVTANDINWYKYHNSYISKRNRVLSQNYVAAKAYKAIFNNIHNVKLAINIDDSVDCSDINNFAIGRSYTIDPNIFLVDEADAYLSDFIDDVAYLCSVEWNVTSGDYTCNFMLLGQPTED